MIAAQIQKWGLLAIFFSKSTNSPFQIFSPSAIGKCGPTYEATLISGLGFCNLTCSEGSGELVAMPWVFVSEVVSGELMLAMSRVLVSELAFCDPLISTCSLFPAKASIMWFPVFVLDAAVMVHYVSASDALRVSAAFFGS
jgi:hypothetical protein